MIKSASLQVAEVMDRDQTDPYTFPHCWDVIDYPKSDKNSRFETILAAAVPSELYKKHKIFKIETFLYSTISPKVIKINNFYVKI